ncbi:hypothetical protein PsorP6_004727 [Peronosclerospora sorghi]|uniref:Uncharacterized protein n=1 Tax=Peronosclerospora sorghi TaxID=230839 RepID=A0ACC0VLF4_9STRA|nr:hypothetical protein PsorP6_004727 [Peronosclerospora sorghi]
MILSNIREKNSAAAEYIDAIPHDQGASFAVSGRRFEHVTSNLAKITISFLKQMRNPALELLIDLYNHQMGKFQEHLQDVQERGSASITPRATKRLKEELEECRKYQCVPNTANSGLVESGPDRQYTVQLSIPGEEQTVVSCT